MNIEKVDKLLYMLDDEADQISNHEEGLPIWNEESLDRMRNIVIKFFNEEMEENKT